MTNNLNTELLDTLKLSTLEIIKNEAEINLDEVCKSEEIITNKSNSLFQILIVIFTSVFGYFIFNFKNELIIHLSLILLFFVGYSIFILKKIIYPETIKLKGAIPFKLVKKDILFFEDENLNNERLLRNRIYSLNIAISENLSSLNKRVDLYRKSNELIVRCLFIIVIYSFVFFLTVPS